MAVKLGGSGKVGLGLENTQGAWKAPQKWIPVLSESLQFVEDKKYRLPIRGAASMTDPMGAVQGYGHTEGDLVFEATADTLIYFLYCMNCSIARSGTGPYTYTTTPQAYATPASPSGSASVLVERNGVYFGYQGLIVSSLGLTIQDDVLVATASMLGLNEVTPASGAATWPTSDVAGPGNHALSISGVTRSDVDTLTITVDEAASVFNALRGDDTRAPSSTRFGLRTATIGLDADFENRTEYDVFRNQTAQAFAFTANVASNNSMQFNAEKLILNNYPVNLTSVGDVVRASGLEFRPVYDSGSGKAYEFVLITGEVLDARAA